MDDKEEKPIAPVPDAEEKPKADDEKALIDLETSIDALQKEGYSDEEILAKVKEELEDDAYPAAEDYINKGNEAKAEKAFGLKFLK